MFEAPCKQVEMGRSAKVNRMGMPAFEKNKKLSKNAAGAPTSKIQKPGPKPKKVKAKKSATNKKS